MHVLVIVPRESGATPDFLDRVRYNVGEDLFSNGDVVIETPLLSAETILQKYGDRKNYSYDKIYIYRCD